MKTRRLHVRLPAGSYPIDIGQGLLSESRLYKNATRGARCLLVSNETIAPLYLELVERALAGAPLSVHVMPDGERFKTMAQCQGLLNAMFRAGLNRDSTLLALGGGVVGDIGGFAAAIYQRGIDFVQIPTTLLAQVDSSVGGKTAVNHPRGKNMIGAFHQPRCVISDLDTLDSLPDRELRAGLAEVIKYALLGDLRFLGWLEKNLDALLARDKGALQHAVLVSCRHKARIVAADELERGQRALLNLGHTFGHAIEAHQRYRDWLHGEAVAAGMVLAADLSHRHGWLDQRALDRTKKLIDRAGLPSRCPPGLNPARMRKLMKADKKVAQGRVRLVLLDGLGTASLRSDYDDDLLSACLRDWCAA